MDPPDGPGVYYFLGAEGELLYAGKATSLRKRLQQHARSPGIAYQRMHEVRWEETPDEAAATAREADVIVALRPLCNKSISGDGKWVFIVVADGTFTLSPSLGLRGRGYGCFPHLGVGISSRPGIACSEGYAAFIRLLWAAVGEDADRVPSRLGSPSPPVEFATSVPPELQPVLHAFLSGTSARLLETLADLAGRRDAYMQPALRRDRVGAEGFFASGPRALRQLRLRRGWPAGPMSRGTFTDVIAADLRDSIGDFRIVDVPDRPYWRARLQLPPS
jgi:predicted GIY-YIG superfamily endonuclease